MVRNIGSSERHPYYEYVPERLNPSVAVEVSLEGLIDLSPIRCVTEEIVVP